jgi:hypothetical protein
VTLIHLDTVFGRAANGVGVDIGTHNARMGMRSSESRGQGACPSAELDRKAALRQQLDSSPGEHFGLGTGDIDASIDEDLMSGEGGETGKPGERLTRQPAGDPALQDRVIAVGSLDHLPGLFVGIHEPSSG